MTPLEFQAWFAFYELHPFDDFNRFCRPAALIAQAAGGGEIGPRLDWLQPPPPPAFDYSEADLNTFKAFGMKPPARS